MHRLPTGKMLFLLSLAVFPSLLWGQTEPSVVCHVSPSTNSQLIQRLEENKNTLDEYPVNFRSVNYIPIKFHLVADSEGNGRALFDEILDQLCVVNNDFADLNMQFYIKDGFDLVNNSAINTNHSNTSFAMSNRVDPDAMNVWVVEDATPSGAGGDGIIAGYYSLDRNKDWIVMRTDKTGDGKPFFTHEVGHYFSLLHPHLGWDSEAYDPEIHGVPAPVRSPDGIATELQDGSNCEVAGDRICDTAPDYNNGLGWSSCDYTLEVLDPSGIKINPDEHLHMGYFFRCLSDRYFSKTQKELMQADYMSSRRRDIRTGFTPIATEINEIPALIEPGNGATTAGFNNVFLEWSAVNGANQYLIQIDRLPTFTSQHLQEFIVGENSTEITGLEAGKRYFWRVRAFNEYVTCTFPSNFASFTTGTTTNTHDLQEITSFSLSPNPAKRNQDLQIELETSRAFDAQVQLFTITGQLVENKGIVRFNLGRHIYQLPLNDLQPGVYLFSMQSDLGKLTERIIVH